MTTRRCKKCNAKLRNTAEYCHVCGTKAQRQAPISKKGKRQIRADRIRRRRVRNHAGAAMIAGTLMILAALAFSSDRSPSNTIVGNVPDTHDEEGIPYPEISRVTLQEAKDKYDSGQALFLDVRSTDEFETEHISNAISMPLADLETRYRDLDPEEEILTYCT